MNCDATPTRKMIVHHTSQMLDHPDEHGLYPTGKFYDDVEKAIDSRVKRAEMRGYNNAMNTLNAMDTALGQADRAVAAVRPYCEFCKEPAPYGDQRNQWHAVHGGSWVHRTYWKIRRSLSGDDDE